MELTQRFLVNRRVRSADGEVLTKYVFLFWDRAWKVVLTLLDRFGAPPAIAHTPISLDSAGNLTLSMPSKDFEPPQRWSPEILSSLFHYDPWWVFRGMGGVSESVKRSILQTNIARSFRREGHHWKVHDVMFAPEGSRVSAIAAKDELFRRREFTREGLDLDSTWPREESRKR